MRPRSRQMAKRRLPTIKEGYEELLQDMNQANSCHAAHVEALSSEAYLQSICQLARPTFPLHEPDCDILALNSLDSIRSGSKPSYVPTPGPSRLPTPTARRHIQGNRGGVLALSSMLVQEGAHHGSPDPLEFLYGHQRSPIPPTDLLGEDGASVTPCCLAPGHSFPCLCFPRAALRKSSCAEFSLWDTTSSAPSPAEFYSPMKNETSDGQPPSCGTQLQKGDAPTGRRENCSNSKEKHSVISHWIADCRSAWREARIRSCMLPAIAEI